MPFTREEQEKYIAEREKEGYTQEEADFFSWLADEYGWFKAWRIELEYPPWMLGEPGGIQDSDYWKYWESIGKPSGGKEEIERPPPLEGVKPTTMPRWRIAGGAMTAEGLPIEIAGGAELPKGEYPQEVWDEFLKTLTREGEELIPDTLVLWNGEYYRPLTGAKVPKELGDAEYNAYLESLKIEPEEEGISPFEEEQLKWWREQAKKEEAQWYTQFFETQQREMYRRQEEKGLAEERGRERMMGERQSIMQLALEREQILAELKAHPRNWIEAEMYKMGTQPYGMSQISPGWGAAPTKTPAPTGQMGVR